MQAGGRLGAALLPAAASSTLPTGHEQLQCPRLSSLLGTSSSISLPSRDSCHQEGSCGVSPHSIPTEMWGATFSSSTSRSPFSTHLASLTIRLLPPSFSGQ